MEEPISRGHRPVRPFHEAACLDKLPVVGEHGQPRLDVFRGLIDGRRHRRRGEGPPGNTRRFQQDLVFRTDMMQLLLDDLAQALWDGTPDGPHGLGDVPSRCLLVQQPLASHLVDGCHQKQGMAAGALMQYMRQLCGERWPPQPLATIRRHFSCRQVVERELRPLLVLGEFRHHGADRMRADNGVHGAIGAEQQEAGRVGTTSDIREPGQRRHVAPVEVFQHQHQRALGREDVQGFGQLA